MAYFFKAEPKKQPAAARRKAMNQGLCYKIVLSGHIGVGKSNIL